MNIEDIKFYAFLAVPFVLLAVLLFFLIFAKRIPSPRFIYKFLGAIALPIKKICSSFSYAISKRVFGRIFIEPSEIPQAVLDRIGPTNRNKILAAVKVLPTIRPMKNGRIYRRNLMLITDEFIYFLVYFKCRPIIQMDKLLLGNISLIEAKTQEVLGLIKKPFISITTQDKTIFTLNFPSNKVGNELIMNILAIFRKAKRELKIVANVPDDLRGDAIRSYDEATREIRQEMNRDLRDIFR
jgi:hypothetical protein